MRKILIALLLSLCAPTFAQTTETLAIELFRPAASFPWWPERILLDPAVFTIDRSASVPVLKLAATKSVTEETWDGVVLAGGCATGVTALCATLPADPAAGTVKVWLRTRRLPRAGFSVAGRVRLRA